MMSGFVLLPRAMSGYVLMSMDGPDYLQGSRECLWSVLQPEAMLTVYVVLPLRDIEM